MKPTIRIYPLFFRKFGKRGNAAGDMVNWKNHFRKLLLLFFAALVVLLSSCAGKKAIIPSITPTPTREYHHGKFVWFDLITNDIPTARKFYGELFGWKFEDHPQDTGFTVIKFNNKIRMGS